MCISPNEQLSRFLFDKSHFAPQKRIVKAAAFIPPRNQKLSVYRISRIPEDEIWQIGLEYVAKPRNRTLRARADLPAEAVYKNNQKVVPDTEVHPLHANIIIWPDDRPSQKHLANQLALASMLVVLPN